MIPDDCDPWGEDPALAALLLGTTSGGDGFNFPFGAPDPLLFRDDDDPFADWD